MRVCVGYKRIVRIIDSIRNECSRSMYSSAACIARRRIGYDVDIVFEPNDQIEIKDNGTILVDFQQGSGPNPTDRQEVFRG